MKAISNAAFQPVQLGLWIGGGEYVGHITFRLTTKCSSGAAEGTRTPDPIITNDVLYQLSYSGHGRALSKVVRACVDLM